MIKRATREQFEFIFYESVSTKNGNKLPNEFIDHLYEMYLESIDEVERVSPKELNLGAITSIMGFLEVVHAKIAEDLKNK